MNYDKFLGNRAINLRPSGIRKFFDVVNEVPNAISLGVGEPDFITPYNIREAAIRSIQKGYTQYTSNQGRDELRELISKYLETRFNLKYDKKQIIVTIGGSEAVDLILRALINPGDEILVPEPCYVSYSPCVSLAGGVPVTVDCFQKDEFKVRPENIVSKITRKTKAIILSFPNNPTGATMEKEQLEKIAEIVLKHDLLVISDEIYAELTYGLKHTSIANISKMAERTVLISGFSKAFAMTGWRIGYICAAQEIIKHVLKIHQYVIMCAPTVSQFAATCAIKDGLSDNFAVIEEMKDEYNKRRRFMVKSFNDLGLKCFEPKGAFYVFPDVSSTGLDGDKFAEKLLKQEKVAVVPGSAFGECGKNNVRCSYAYSMENLDTAIERISNFLK
ncbi:MAG: aminotransferase class I/II-fold pyridoxal phosphate-dependent enzyme [Firmicutes bacterium]|nr:aminotransferase class I/II-fold pyridoxal phosphate-dependent enzyme [Bacillota bacterium]